MLQWVGKEDPFKKRNNWQGTGKRRVLYAEGMDGTIFDVGLCVLPLARK